MASEVRAAHPSDEELFSMFNSTDGDSSYDGWLAIYRAGVAEGIRRAREALDLMGDPSAGIVPAWAERERGYDQARREARLRLDALGVEE